MDKVMIGWTTVDSRHAAERLAMQILDARLAACIQITDEITSYYRYEGKDEKSQEWCLAIKFPESRAEALETCILQHHPYDTPQWVALTADRAHLDYAKWVEGSCKG